jgi:GTP-binding protein HflX
MKKTTAEDVIQLPRTLIVGVQSPLGAPSDINSYFEEFKNLVRSNGIEYTQELFIKLRSIDSAYYITKGKLEDLIELCDKEQIEEVIFSVPLSVQQERNLSEMLQCRVFDRTQLILEIFERGAQSADGKLQVALALLHHMKSRLAGRGIHMSQQGGRIGTRGPGETQKEKEKQDIEHRMLKLRRDLQKLEKVRETQRKRRLVVDIPQICLIGYTNAGKSTILNHLTHSNVLAEDKLFATLDTTTRELYIDGKKKGLISDTVGFIQQLPHHLIEAFKSTLSELQYAHLLLHVVDSADTNWEHHIRVVNEVLAELELQDKQILYVFNKIDRLTAAQREQFEQKITPYLPQVLVSALTIEGLQPLIDFLRTWTPNKE